MAAARAKLAARFTGVQTGGAGEEVFFFLLSFLGSCVNFIGTFRRKRVILE